MPAYNAETYLNEAIRSALEQTLKDLELVIINDGSTDRTAEIARSFKDSRIRVIENKMNSGLVAVRNQAIALAQGEYIAWLDADDIALPSRIEKQVRFLDAHPDFALVGTWVELIDRHGHKTGVHWKNRAKPEDMRAALFFGNQFTQSAVMIRKSDLPDSAYRNEYAPAEDYDLWIRLAEKKNLANLPKILTRYRVLPKSASHGGEGYGQAKTRVAADNLARLGITPTDEEYILHQTNFDYQGGNEKDFLKKRENWLLKLIEANDKKKVFDIASFRKVAGERWLSSCRANAEGKKTWKRCWHSPLARSISKTERGRDIAKLFVACIIMKP